MRTRNKNHSLRDLINVYICGFNQIMWDGGGDLE